MLPASVLITGLHLYICDLGYNLSSFNHCQLVSTRFHLMRPLLRFMYRVKVGESLFSEASAPSKKAARQLAAEEAVKELMAGGRLQLNKVRS